MDDEDPVVQAADAMLAEIEREEEAMPRRIELLIRTLE